MPGACLLCDRSAWGRGLCVSHYQKHRRRGDLEAVALPKRDPNADRRAPGRSIDRNGYVQVKLPGQPVRSEHRIVMEGVIGRPLSAGENVHHINGVRTDNRPENLELWLRPQPHGQRVDDLLKYAVAHHADRLRAMLAGVSSTNPPREQP